ncbi:uncharacterized protein LOC143180133 [Calliopsis andreniformis]|uniref:uncharacterized protein LOC143180133 n=1 Tax=Calliopsis andreniformis TaxID=337506 RepID=UPI003FCCC2B7
MKSLQLQTTIMTRKNMCYKKGVGCNKSEKEAVLKLDAYIKKYEKKFGKISSLRVLSKKQIKLVKLMRKLIDAIESEEINKQQAFKILQVSNDAIKDTILKLQDSMKMYKENMRSEIAKLDCLSTDRLLKINYAYI